MEELFERFALSYCAGVGAGVSAGATGVVAGAGATGCGAITGSASGADGAGWLILPAPL
jgi:hypothetical protein